VEEVVLAHLPVINKITMQKKNSHGLTLIELVIVLFITLLIASVTIYIFSDQDTKEQAAYQLLKAAARGAINYRHDTGCYPSNIVSLIQKSNVPVSTTQNCVPNLKLWNGPYLRGNFNVQASSGLQIRQNISTTGLLNIIYSNKQLVKWENAPQYAAVISDVNAQLADEFKFKCNPDNSNGESSCFVQRNNNNYTIGIVFDAE
jgi:type II secretory pathway pseudopilin PulG